VIFREVSNLSDRRCCLSFRNVVHREFCFVGIEYPALRSIAGLPCKTTVALRGEGSLRISKRPARPVLSYNGAAEGSRRRQRQVVDPDLLEKQALAGLLAEYPR
jgi:hypothetical protein